MRLRIHHETLYRYTAPLQYSIQQLRLTPRSEPHQRILSWQLQMPGEPHTFLDAFHNPSHLLTWSSACEEIRLVASGEIDIQPLHDGRLAADEALSPLIFLTPTRLTQDTPAIARFARRHFATERQHRLDAYLELAAAVRTAIRYESGATSVSTTADDALQAGRGVCQDHAHLFLACCRTHDIPARYVSGYIDPGSSGHAETHAWVDVWLNDGSNPGWISLDVTHACTASDRHCRLAIGRDYESAAPVRGIRRGGGAESMQVRVDVQVLA